MALQKEKYHRDIVSGIAKEEEVDNRVADFVATHPFLFTSRVCRDPENKRPVRIRYWGVYAIRGNNKKK